MAKGCLQSDNCSPGTAASAVLFQIANLLLSMQGYVELDQSTDLIEMQELELVPETVVLPSDVNWLCARLSCCKLDSS